MLLCLPARPIHVVRDSSWVDTNGNLKPRLKSVVFSARQKPRLVSFKGLRQNAPPQRVRPVYKRSPKEVVLPALLFPMILLFDLNILVNFPDDHVDGGQ